MLNIERPSKWPEKDWLPKTKKARRNYIHGMERRKHYKPDIDEYHEHTLRICIVTTDPLSEKFNRLLAEWREQSATLSSITAMAMLPPYQEIIGMGKPALPLILNELKKEPDYLFWALKSITGIDPVPPEDIGDMDLMTSAWIGWGRRHGIIE